MNKYVFIISEETDSTTCDVMDWLESFGSKAVRLNSEMKIDSCELFFSTSDAVDFKFNFHDGKFITLNEISSFWYRRGQFVFDVNRQNLESIEENFRPDVIAQMQLELDSLKRTLYQILSLKPSIGHPNNSSVDKLSVLILAKALGLDIPDSMVTTNDAAIIKFTSAHESIITKAIGENLVLNFEIENNEHVFGMTYTEEIFASDLAIGHVRFPSFVQEKLDKEFDIRVFYLNGVCYSMAIFSQLEKQTSTDFRNYNTKKKQRVSPYLMPDEVCDKIKKLMESLNLNSGSIDFVLTKGGRHVFLEVNPVGQFGMVSYPCNFQLEKKIAQYLTDYGG